MPHASSSAFSMMHKQTLMPAPEVEPPPVFHPLKPAKKGQLPHYCHDDFPFLVVICNPQHTEQHIALTIIIDVWFAFLWEEVEGIQ